MIAIPKSLSTYKSLDSLCRLLLEQKRSVESTGTLSFGPRVARQDQGERLLGKVAAVTLEVLREKGKSPAPPRLTLGSKIPRLPRQTLKLYLFLGPPGVALLGLNLRDAASPSHAILAALFSVALLAMPLVIHRRALLNIEHDCRYTRTSDGGATISIDQLAEIPFQSYLAHEYAHHLYYELHQDEGQGREPWKREGWARLVQWEAMRRLAREEDNPAYLHHVNLQIVGELKFACMLVGSALHKSLPAPVRRLRTIYSANPLYRLVTGTPGYDPYHLAEHAAGTAVFFLARRNASSLSEALARASSPGGPLLHREQTEQNRSHF